MIPAEQLERWALLYDLGYQNLDGWSDPKAFAVRTELKSEIERAYNQLLLRGSVPFGEFHRKALQQIKALLKNRPPRI